MSLIPDTATFHKYLTISNGQIGFTPEARTSPYADHFYPPGWNIVPNRGVVSYNPLTVATWLMGTMPGMEGVSRNEYMLKDDTEDAIVAESSPSNGSFKKTGVQTVDTAAIEETESGNEDVSMEDTERIEDTVFGKDTVQLEDTANPPSNGSFGAVSIDTVSQIEDVSMEDTMPSEDNFSSPSNGSFEGTEPAKDTELRSGDVTMNGNTTVDVPDPVSSPENQNTVPTTSLESRKRKICSNCSSTESKKVVKGLCINCYRYQTRNNKPRPFPDTSIKKNKVCSNCSTTESCRWFNSRLKTGRLCQACSYYEGRHNTARPFEHRIPIAKLNKICSNCSTTETCRWHYNPSKMGLFCSNCYLYKRRNKTTRPAALNDTIQIKDMEKKCAECSRTDSLRWIKHESGLICQHCYNRKCRMARKERNGKI